MKHNPHSASDLWQAVNQIIGRYSTIKSKLPGNFSLNSINNFFHTVAIALKCQAETMFVPVSLPQLPYKFIFEIIIVSIIFSASSMENLEISWTCWNIFLSSERSCY